MMGSWVVIKKDGIRFSSGLTQLPVKISQEVQKRARNNLGILLPLPPGEGWGEGI